MLHHDPRADRPPLIVRYDDAPAFEPVPAGWRPVIGSAVKTINGTGKRAWGELPLIIGCVFTEGTKVQTAVHICRATAPDGNDHLLVRDVLRANLPAARPIRIGTYRGVFALCEHLAGPEGPVDQAPTRQEHDDNVAAGVWRQARVAVAVRADGHRAYVQRHRSTPDDYHVHLLAPDDPVHPALGDLFPLVDELAAAARW